MRNAEVLVAFEVDCSWATGTLLFSLYQTRVTGLSAGSESPCRSAERKSLMLLTTRQMDAYHADGYLLLPPCFEAAEIAALKDEVAREFAVDSDRRVLEKDSAVVRSV